MKLIMENWRLYSSKSDFEILCERHTFNLITESQLVEGWENLVLTEMNELIEEGVLDVLSVGYEKGKQLVGKAKETWDAAIWNVTSFLLKLSTQAEKLIQTVSRGLGRIASVIKKVIQFVNPGPDVVTTTPGICNDRDFVYPSAQNPLDISVLFFINFILSR